MGQEGGWDSFAFASTGAELGSEDAGLHKTGLGRPPWPPRRPGNARVSRELMAGAEAFAVTLSSVAAGIGYHLVTADTLGPVRMFLATGVLAGLIYAVMSYTLEGRRRLREPLSPDSVIDASALWATTILLVTFFAFSFKASEELSRGSVMTLVAVGYLALLLTRALMPRLAGNLVQLNYGGEQVLLIGASNHEAVEALSGSYASMGILAPPAIELITDCTDSTWQAELPAVLARIYDLARESPQGEICIAASGFRDSQLRDLLTGLQPIPRAVRVVPVPHVERLLHLPRRNVGELYAVELQRSPMGRGQRAAKRTLDFILAFGMLVFVSPLLLAAAAAIKIDSKGPVLFRQRRLGRGGVPFTIYKFRSMTVMEDGADIRQAQKNDQRVTATGRWLRKTSIDELPQLLNVLKGNMSLVGPRPHAEAHDRLFANLVEHYEVRQHVKPGITGWAQVNGLRGETSALEQMRKRVEFDLYYAKNASVWFDCRILLMTVVEVLRQRNAY